jgi:hypothetical protein
MENDSILMERGITKDCLNGRNQMGEIALYLGEYVWRYNHRNDTDKIKMKRILKLLDLEVSG